MQIPEHVSQNGRRRADEAPIVRIKETTCAVSSKKDAFLMVDLLVALAILSLALVPIGFSFAHERQVLKLEYFRSVANEIVDGEIEVLAAGDWKNFPDGPQNYAVHANAAAKLPPGHFQLTKNGNHLRLEWNSYEKHGVGAIAREVTIK